MKSTIKRTLTVLLALMLVWAACSVATLAKETAGTITASTATAKSGETVDVTLSLDKNPGFVNLQVKVGYDADVLTLTGVTNGTVHEKSNFSKNLTKNPYTLTWEGDTFEENVTATGTLATLTFTVAENAALGDSTITVTFNSADDFDLNDVNFDGANGKVTVTHDHTYSDEWSTDAEKHWHACTANDGGKNEEAAHTFATREQNRIEPADCTTDGSYEEVSYCTVCGYENSPVTKTIKAPGHKWAEAWSADGTYHYHVCTVCGTAIDEETKAEHTWSNEYSKDSTEHWHECTVCGATDTKAAHIKGEATQENITPATCSAEGSYDEVYYCTECGAEIERNANQKIDKLPHTKGDAVKENDNPSTCIEKGTYDEVYYCTVCGEEISRDTKTYEEFADHTWSNEYSKDSTGHWLKCTVCGADNVESYATHDFEETKVIDKPATCGEPGEYHMADKCTICGYEKNPSETKYDPPTGEHTWKETWESNDEGHWHICSVCGNPDKESYAAHIKSEAKIDKDPTTEAEGAWHTECTVCGKVTASGSIDKLEVYEVTDGNNSVFKKSTKTGIKVTTKVPANDAAGHVSVKVNGEELTAEDYDINGDEYLTIILKPEYLETLAKGEYKLEVYDGRGVATSTFTVEEETAVVTPTTEDETKTETKTEAKTETKTEESKSPKTGNPVLFWVILALLGNAVLVGSTVYRKKVR